MRTRFRRGSQAPARRPPISRPAASCSTPQPRIISNLIVDQTANNPAAVPRRPPTPGRNRHQPRPGWPVRHRRRHAGQFHSQRHARWGLSSPFNAWMTFFGQFFDHGLDLVTKGSTGTVFIPLAADDPLVRRRQPDQFHGADARHRILPGPDGITVTILGATATRRRRPRKREHHLAVRRPEPDLHLASLAPGVPARLRARRRRAPSRPAS